MACYPACVVVTELNDEVIILEGTAALSSDPAVIRQFVEVYSPKYEYDMQGFADPVYRVRPRMAFAFITRHEEFIGSTTRWIFP